MIKIEACTRLLSMPIKMGEGMAGEEVHDIRNLCHALITNRKSQHVASVGDLEAIIMSCNKTVFICLVDKSLSDFTSVKAFIKILPQEKIGVSPFVNGVWADPSLRGAGIGLALYQLALASVGGLQSDSDNIGIMAVKTWQKLNNKYIVDLYVRQGRSYAKTDYTWGTNSIPIVNGTPVDKVKTKFIFHTEGKPR